MSGAVRAVGDRLAKAGSGVLAGWVRFWFRPMSMYPLGVLRIFFGTIVFLWAWSLLPGLSSLIGPHSVLADPNRGGPLTWTLLSVFNTDTAVLILWAVLVIGSAALVLGWHSRLAALVVFVAIVSFERRQPWIFNAGDGMLRIESLFLLLAPAGAALSLDQRRRTGAFFSAEDRAPWALRLFQIQLSIVYLATVWDKVRGDTWNAGTAVSYSLRLLDLQNFVAPEWLVMNPLLMNLAAWGTLAIELGIGMFVWHRKARPWVLAAGVVLHLTILLSIAVGFFSFAVFVLYLSFLSPETARRGAEWMRGRLRRRPPPDPAEGDVLTVEVPEETVKTPTSP
ncbi:HTTM domain-containing protein [Fodinicola acaciae]|uniref:HTTM domain-containing protein n=1 Tax=Fodinicola acaciae TaxID=2681555 RepID=UPI0013D09570|nr:HTTM domain-containing protein [Fodinicola acaciae]